MAIGTLTGYAIPVIGLGFVDHTYVEASNGFTCGCFGRSAGGSVVCSGHGNVDQAACLATPALTAGIDYGVTGVCHQSANRILWPAGLNVLSAKGARGSVYAWGLYGLDPTTRRKCSPATTPWSELAVCLTSHSHP